MTEQQQEQQQEQPAGPVDLSQMSPAEIRNRAIELWGKASFLAGMSPVMRAAWKDLSPAQIRQLVAKRDPVTLTE